MVRQEFGLAHLLLSGKEDVILVSRCDLGSSWHKVVVQLLKISPVLTWGNVSRLEGNAVADVMMQTFEKHGRNNAYKDSKIWWLLLSCIDYL